MPLPRHPAQPDGQKHFKNQNYLCNLQQVKYGLLIRLPSTRMFSAQLSCRDADSTDAAKIDGAVGRRGGDRRRLPSAYASIP